MPTWVGFGQPIWAAELFVLLLATVPQLRTCSLLRAQRIVVAQCHLVQPSRETQPGAHPPAAMADVLHLTGSVCFHGCKTEGSPPKKEVLVFMLHAG